MSRGFDGFEIDDFRDSQWGSDPSSHTRESNRRRGGSSQTEASVRIKLAKLREAEYQWLHGQITAGAVSEEFRRLAPRREVSFRTDLVDGQTTLFEPRVPTRNRKTGDQEVTDRLQETFGPDFKATFGGETQ
jgi:hypothetical protein